MWMPPHTTRPPLRSEASASGTNDPTGAKMMAASSCSGARSVEAPAQLAPSELAIACAAVSPGRVKA